MTSIAASNAADRAAFVAAVGFAFENSPWIAEAAWERRPFATSTLCTPPWRRRREAPRRRKVALIAAHPDLAGRVAREGRLTAASRGEQAAAGLDRLDAEEIARFDAAQRRVSRAVRLSVRDLRARTRPASICGARTRARRNERATEIATALDEIAKIARLRLRRRDRPVMRPTSRLAQPAGRAGCTSSPASPGSAPRSISSGSTTASSRRRPAASWRTRASAASCGRCTAAASTQPEVSRPARARAAARGAALVQVGSLFDLAHRLRAARVVYWAGAEHIT